MQACWSWCRFRMPDQKAGTLTYSMLSKQDLEIGDWSLCKCPVMYFQSFPGRSDTSCNNAILWVADCILWSILAPLRSPKLRILWVSRCVRRSCRWLVEPVLQHVCSDESDSSILWIKRSVGHQVIVQLMCTRLVHMAHVSAHCVPGLYALWKACSRAKVQSRWVQ